MSHKIAVIGSGRWGTNIINTLMAMNKEVVISNTKGIYNNKDCYDDWLKMLYEVRPNGVIVAANPAMHISVAKYCDDLNIPLLLEKPAAFFYKDIHKMATYRNPIMVDYVYLYHPKYMTLKSKLKSPITKIVSVNYNDGPIRHYSSLFDYGVHDLAFAFDLLNDATNIKVEGYKVKDCENKGQLFMLDLKSNGRQIVIKCGNGGKEKVRKLSVFCKNGDVLTFDDSESNDKAPLRNVLSDFCKVIDGDKPRIPFVKTMQIHKVLNDLGNQWEMKK